MLNCLIVDDEPLARKQIEYYVSKIPFLKLVGIARNPTIATDILQTEMVDLIFLDIKMPQLTGTEFLRNHDIFQQVIFITAFPEYAIEGFELEVTDYLMKPVPFKRFLKACEKAMAKVAGVQTIKLIKDQPNFLYVKCNQRFQRIWINEILYIESRLNYINIVTASGKYMVYSSLTSAAGSLQKGVFLRIHKSYLVAIKHIDTIENHQINIKGNLLPVSRSNWQKLIQTALNLGITYFHS